MLCPSLTRKTFNHLLPLLPTYSQAVAILQLIENSFPHLRHEPLTVKQLPAFASLRNKATQPLVQEAQVQGKGSCKAKPPHPDPFDEEPPLDHLTGGLVERFRSSERGLSAKDFLEKSLEKHPRSCRLAVEGLQVVRSSALEIKDEDTHQNFCISGVFTLVLRLMSIEPASAHLQGLGLECFFELMGGYTFHESLPAYSVDVSMPKMTDATRALVMVTVMSLAEVTEYGGLRTLVNALLCVVEQYNLGMTREEKR